MPGGILRKVVEAEQRELSTSPFRDVFPPSLPASSDPSRSRGGGGGWSGVGEWGMGRGSFMWKTVKTYFC